MKVRTGRRTIVIAALWLEAVLAASAQTSTYDSVDRLVQVRYDGTRSITYGYDAHGYLTNMTFTGNLPEEDSDSDSMADAWEWVWFNSLTNTAAGDFNQDTKSNVQHYQDGTDPTDPDSDGDGMSNTNELLAGTLPLDASSFLGLTQIVRQAGSTGIVVRWQSVDGKRYTLSRATNLVTGFDYRVQTNILGIAPANVATDNNTVGTGPCSYRIELE